MPRKKSNYKRSSSPKRARLWRFELLESRALLAGADEVSVPFVNLVPLHVSTDNIASVTSDHDQETSLTDPTLSSSDPADISQAADDAMSSTDNWIQGGVNNENAGLTERPMNQPAPSEDAPKQDDDVDNDNEEDHAEDNDEATLSKDDTGKAGTVEDGPNATPERNHLDPHWDRSRSSTMMLLSPATTSHNQIAPSDATTASVMLSQRSTFNYFVTTEQPHESRPSLSSQMIGGELTHDTYMTLKLLTTSNDATTSDQQVARKSQRQHQTHGSDTSITAASEQDQLADSTNDITPDLRPETRMAIELALSELQQLDVMAEHTLITTHALGIADASAQIAMVGADRSTNHGEMVSHTIVAAGLQVSAGQRPWMWSIVTVASLILTSQHRQRSTSGEEEQHFNWLKPT